MIRLSAALSVCFCLSLAAQAGTPEAGDCADLSGNWSGQCEYTINGEQQPPVNYSIRIDPISCETLYIDDVLHFIDGEQTTINTSPAGLRITTMTRTIWDKQQLALGLMDYSKSEDLNVFPPELLSDTSIRSVLSLNRGDLIMAGNFVEREAKAGDILQTSGSFDCKLKQ